MLRRWLGVARSKLARRRVLAYLVLLLASNIFIAVRSASPSASTPAGAERLTLRLPRMSTSGPIAGGEYRLSVLRWKPEAAEPQEPRSVIERLKERIRGPDPQKLPVILLHGAPSGGGSDWRRFAPRLVEAGYTVYAPDLPGSGASMLPADDYSILATARLLIAAIDQLGIERAHIVGWSQGGGAALHMADLAPKRVASLTMLASIGMQETEGSGDFFFEHLKYRLGHTLLVTLPELIPHFGLLGSRASRWAMLRPFMDTDQRPLKALMQRLSTPTLILHGRHDFMVPAWAAETHHEVIRPSTLVMLDAGHFIPLGPPLSSREEADDALRHLLVHLDRHNDPKAAALRGQAIFCPPEAHITQMLGGFEIKHGTPWWLIIIIITLATLISEDLTIVTVGLLMVSQSIDWGVALVGCFIAIVVGDLGLWMIGRTLGRRALKLPVIRNVINESSLEKWGEVLDQHTGKTVFLSRCLPGTRMPTFIAAGILSKKAHLFMFWVAIAAFVWTPFLLLLTALIGPSLLGFFQTVFHGPWAIVAAIVVVFLVIRLVAYETTAMGRDRLKADLLRFITIEFWPPWIFYLPFVPCFLWLSLRYRGPMTFTCANPGIECGGGLMGESKARILRSLLLGGPEVARFVAPCMVVPAGGSPKERADKALGLLRDHPDLGGFPIILKPDHGCRGYGLKLAGNEEQLRAYFESMVRPVMVQKYHPGPYELGVLWARVPSGSGPVDDWNGEVFSATGKDFPVLIGDGRRSFEMLVWHHRRFRMQADVFLKRHAAHSDRVLPRGERFVLAVAGNHCQGTRFYDGMPAVTHELAARIESICQAFRDPDTGARLDFARMDLRFESEADLAAGHGFTIIELNGTSSESTSMYDPTKSIRWTYGLLYRHWARLFTLGAARRREGVRPMPITRLWRHWREDRRTRSAPAISD